MTNTFLIVETANSRPFLNVQDNEIVYDYKRAKGYSTFKEAELDYRKIKSSYENYSILNTTELVIYQPSKRTYLQQGLLFGNAVGNKVATFEDASKFSTYSDAYEFLYNTDLFDKGFMITSKELIELNQN